MAYVVVLPAPAEEEVVLQDGNMRVDVLRHGGDRDLGISSSDLVLRMTHLPTGLQVLCHKPKSTNSCLLALRARVLNRQRGCEGKQIPVIQTYNLPANGVIDIGFRR